MALTDSNDPNKDFINALTYLGKGPFNIGMPGGSDIAVGAGPAPAPGVNVGTFGQNFGGGPAMSGAVGPGGSGGSDILGMLQNYLKAGGKSADFLGKLGSGSQGSDILKDMGASGELGLGADTQLSGLGTELPSTELGSTPDMAALLKDLQGTLGSSSLSDPTLGVNLTTGLGSEAGAGASSLAGNIGTGATGAGALAAILGAIAASSGNKDLGTAAGALGAGAGVAGTAAAEVGAAGAAEGGTAAAGGAVGAAAAPLGVVAAPLIFAEIAKLAGAGGLDISDFWTGGKADPWATFGTRLGQTMGNEGQDLGYLSQALPYVQSQQDLQNLLGLYRGSVEQGGVGGYGAGAGPFDIPGLPAGGGSSHEGGITTNFDPQTALLQQVVNAYKPMLPETGGGNIGDIWNTLNQQAQTQTQREDIMGLLPYVDPATAAQYQQFLGSQPTLPASSSPQWQQLMAGITGAGQQAAAPQVVDPNAAGTAPNDVYQDLLKQYGMA